MNLSPDGNRMTYGVIMMMVTLLVALAVTMLTYGRSESHWRATLQWDRATAGAAEQLTGIQQQRAAQAGYAATGDPLYKAAFERGVRNATAGSQAVLAVGDPEISAITRQAESADLQHDRVVRRALFPAVETGDRRASTAALDEANRLVDVGYRSAVRIDARVDALRAQDVHEARSTEQLASSVGFTALALALLTGLAGTLLVARAQRRRRAAQHEREHLLELTRSQNIDLMRLDREKDAFIASVSHELRTPLTSIRGYTELVGEESDNLTEQQRHFLGIVDRNASRLLSLINDLLLAAQIDAAGALDIEREDVDLSALAEQAVESAGPAASMKDIELRASYEREAMVKGDALRLSQVLDNLISNAVKFTPNGGRVHVRLVSDDERVRLEVEDTGMGMTQEEQSRLFERFYRTEGATENAVQGSGLGLAISQAIAHAHDGMIVVRSEKGIGSTFALDLPRAAPTALPAESEHLTSPGS